MSFDHWLAFVAASVIVLVLPGPTVLLVLSYALTYGQTTALAVVTGVALGSLVTMTLCLLGLGAILSASATLLTLLRWLAGGYAIYLGTTLIRSPPSVGGAFSEHPASTVLTRAFSVTAFNPKYIAFFVLFVPQFMDTSRAFWPQFGVFETTFVSLAALNAGLYTWMGTGARKILRHPSILPNIHKIFGALLIGAGVLIAGWHHSGP